MFRLVSAGLIVLAPFALRAQQPRGMPVGHVPSTAVVIAPFRESADGFTQYSGLTDSMRIVIRDAAAWQRYWTAIHRPFIPAPAIPEVDFTREMVLLAALGSQPTAGYGIRIETALADSGGMLVQVRRTTPGSGCALPAVVTQPVDLVRVPASGLPVLFSERMERLDCPGRPALDRD